jgi:hypothetical protein
MHEIALDHLDDVRCAGHVNAEVALIELIDDLLESANKLLAVFA